METHTNKDYEIMLANMTARVKTLIAANDHQAAQLAFARKEFQALGEQLIEAATDADLCEEFDSFVEEANKRLTFAKLPTRQVEYNTSITLDISAMLPFGVDGEDIYGDLYCACVSAIRDVAYDNDIEEIEIA